MDVVYTWVQRRTGTAVSGDHRARRYLDLDEIRFSLRALERFAPWAGRVFLVTDGAAPGWLDRQHPDLTLVRHEEIFPDPRTLPTHNSNAIELFLHRIPGLSDPFVYFNDDMLLAAPHEPADFFTASEGPRVRFARHLVPREGDRHWLGTSGAPDVLVVDPEDVWLRSLQFTDVLLDQRYQERRRPVLGHAPYTLTHAAYELLHALWPAAVRATTTHAVRQPDDLNTVHALAQILRAEPARDPAWRSVVIDATAGCRVVEVNNHLHHLMRQLATLRDPGTTMSCLQTEADDIMADTVGVLHRFLGAFLPLPSRFEAF